MAVRLFDPNFYRRNNPDVGGLNDTEALQHFLNVGVSENRPFSPIADLEVYRQSNPDLIQAGLTTNRQLFDHLENVGVAEGRQFSTRFDPSFYQQSYPDLREAGIDTNEELFEHFQAFGVNEGRLGAPSNAEFGSSPTPPPPSPSSPAPPDPLPSSPVTPNPSTATSVPVPPLPPTPNTSAEPPGPLPEAPTREDPVSFSEIPTDTGDSLNADLGGGVNNFNLTFNDVVGGSSDPSDYYRFNLRENGSFNVSLYGSGVGLEVYRDGNEDGTLEPAEVFLAGANGLIGSSGFGGPSTSFGGSAIAGSYYLRVFAENPNTDYQLTLSAYSNVVSPPPPVF